MVLFRDFGWFQVLLIVLFALFCVLYAIRVARIGRALNTPFYRIFIKLALRTGAFGLLLIAFLGPSYGDSKKEIKAVGKDIMICVNLSKSMAAFDIQPTRLEKINFQL